MLAIRVLMELEDLAVQLVQQERLVLQAQEQLLAVLHLQHGLDKPDRLEQTVLAQQAETQDHRVLQEINHFLEIILL